MLLEHPCHHFVGHKNDYHFPRLTAQDISIKPCISCIFNTIRVTQDDVLRALL